MTLKKLFLVYFRKLTDIVIRGSQTDEVLVQFQSRIGYKFKDLDLLRHSLTHRSHVTPSDKKRLGSNERLEFLGDSVLNCLVTDELYSLYPKKSEGQLSKMKSLLISRKILGEIGNSIDLGYYMIMGMSERKGVENTRFSIVSNAFEAIIGAVYLDGGFESARGVLQKLLFIHFDKFLSDEDNINYKSKILELAQGNGFGIPFYPTLSETGPDHAKNFVVAVEIGGVRLGEGTGSNKKNAQQNAAKDAVENYNAELLENEIEENKNSEE